MADGDNADDRQADSCHHDRYPQTSNQDVGGSITDSVSAVSLGDVFVGG